MKNGAVLNRHNSGKWLMGRSTRILASPDKIRFGTTGHPAIPPDFAEAIVMMIAGVSANGNPQLQIECG